MFLMLLLLHRQTVTIFLGICLWKSCEIWLFFCDLPEGLSHVSAPNLFCNIIYMYRNNKSAGISLSCLFIMFCCIQSVNFFSEGKGGWGVGGGRGGVWTWMVEKPYVVEKIFNNSFGHDPKLYRPHVDSESQVEGMFDWNHACTTIGQLLLLYP